MLSPLLTYSTIKMPTWAESHQACVRVTETHHVFFFRFSH